MKVFLDTNILVDYVEDRNVFLNMPLLYFNYPLSEKLSYTQLTFLS